MPVPAIMPAAMPTAMPTTLTLAPTLAPTFVPDWFGALIYAVAFLVCLGLLGLGLLCHRLCGLLLERRRHDARHPPAYDAMQAVG
jgi:hypothetical protein